MNYNIATVWVIALVVLAVWEVFWKGLALWRAARNQQMVWFVAILIINSAGILPIIYLLMVKGSLKTKGDRHDLADN